jgi:hypothetical protein
MPAAAQKPAISRHKEKERDREGERKRKRERERERERFAFFTVSANTQRDWGEFGMRRREDRKKEIMLRYNVFQKYQISTKTKKRFVSILKLADRVALLH